MEQIGTLLPRNSTGKELSYVPWAKYLRNSGGKWELR